MEHVRQDPNQAEHSAILRAVVRLDTLFNVDASLERLRVDVVQLRGTLVRHFQAEESSWLHDGATTEYPRAAELVQRLIGEHGAMLGLLDQLVRGDDSEPEQHRESWSAFSELLKRHERDESELLQSLLYNDLGGLG